jgi:hypothetical protein
MLAGSRSLNSSSDDDVLWGSVAAQTRPMGIRPTKPLNPAAWSE